MEDDLKNKYNLKMKKIMFLSVLGVLRRRSDYCHRVAIFWDLGKSSMKLNSMRVVAICLGKC